MKRVIISGCRVLGAMAVVSFSLLFPVSFPAVAQSPTIGVDIDQTTTTTAPPNSTSPPNTTAPPTTSPPTTTARTTPVTSTPPRTTAPSTSTTLPTTTTIPVVDDTLPDIAPPFVSKADEGDKGVVNNFKAGVKVTSKMLKDISGGKPVADAAEAVLPAEVANVVVPAIKTTSTFAFPVTLAAGVVAFLIVQRRIDASDPKLAASTTSHDESEVRFR